MTTCGLTYFGAPTVDEGQPLGLHGRASNLAATNLAYGADWHGDEYELWVSGQIREVRFFGENVVLRRRISAWLGQLEAGGRGRGDQRGPRDDAAHDALSLQPGLPGAQRGLGAADRRRRGVSARRAAAPGCPTTAGSPRPRRATPSRCSSTSRTTDAEGFARAALVNRAFDGGRGLGAYLRWRTAELPWMIQWKQIGQGAYVAGLEPATNWTIGRAAERAAGRLKFLEPGETRHYRLELGVLASQAEIDAFAAGLPR